MKFISLFAGVGGFDLALERLGHECVFANDNNEGYPNFEAKKIYDKHFKIRQDTRDIRTIAAREIPYADLLVGGFPCPDFSIAGKRAGFSGRQGDLFFEIIRILKTKRTPYIILENVRGLLNHLKGETFKTVLNELGTLGYELQWFLCDSQNFGVAQQRKRVFIIGNLRGHTKPEIFTKRQGYCRNDTKKYQMEPRGLCLNTRTGERQDPTEESFIGHIIKSQQGSFYNSKAEKIIGYCLTKKDRGVGNIWNETHIARIDTIGKRTNARFSKRMDRIRGRMLGNAVTVDVVYEIVKSFSEEEFKK